MPAPVVFTVKGLDDIQRGFRSLRQPELTRTAKPAYQEASKKVLVPNVQREARSASTYSGGPSRTRGKRGTRGPLASNVTARLIKRSQMPASIRTSVLFAYGTGPRAWYRHLVIKGTRRHSTARGSRLRGNIGQNIPPIHPGARANDFVGRAQQRGQAPFLAFFNGVLMARYRNRARSR